MGCNDMPWGIANLQATGSQSPVRQRRCAHAFLLAESFLVQSAALLRGFSTGHCAALQCLRRLREGIIVFFIDRLLMVVEKLQADRWRSPEGGHLILDVYGTFESRQLTGCSRRIHGRAYRRDLVQIEERGVQIRLDVIQHEEGIEICQPTLPVAWDDAVPLDGSHDLLRQQPAFGGKCGAALEPEMQSLAGHCMRATVCYECIALRRGDLAYADVAGRDVVRPQVAEWLHDDDFSSPAGPRQSGCIRAGSADCAAR